MSNEADEFVDVTISVPRGWVDEEMLYDDSERTPSEVYARKLKTLAEWAHLDAVIHWYMIDESIDEVREAMDGLGLLVDGNFSEGLEWVVKEIVAKRVVFLERSKPEIFEKFLEDVSDEIRDSVDVALSVAMDNFKRIDS